MAATSSSLEHRHTDDEGQDVYLCIDCGCNEDEPITDLEEHEKWHAKHPHAWERQTVADLAELFDDDEYWDREPAEEDEDQLAADKLAPGRTPRGGGGWRKV